MLPSNARQRRVALEERLGRLKEYVETTPLNYAIWGDRRLGIVTSSIATVYTARFSQLPRSSSWAWPTRCRAG